MERARLIDWIFANPLMFITILMVVAFIVYLFKGPSSNNIQEEAEDDSDEPENKPQISQIVIMAPDGKVIRTYVALTRSIDYDSTDGIYIEFREFKKDSEDHRGRQIRYVLGQHAAEIIDFEQD